MQMRNQKEEKGWRMMDNNKSNTGRFQNTKENTSGSGGRFSGSSSNKKKVNYSGGYSSNQNKDNYFLLIIGFVLAIIPLITHAKTYDPDLVDFDWFSVTTSNTDIFLYWKQFFFIGTLIVMLICFAVSFFGNKKKFLFQPIFIPLAVYAVFCLLSTVFSKYSQYGFTGIFEQFESVFCLLGYAAIVYFVYLYVNNEKDVRLLINVLAVGALIIGLIGMFQGMKYDLFRSNFGKSLIASSTVPASSLEFNFEVGRTYATLYNPNYVGVYCTLVIPIFTVLTGFAKNIKERILYAAVVVTLLVSMFAAQFKAGIVSLVFVALIGLFMLSKKLIKKWYIVLPAVFAVIVLFVIVDTVGNHVYSTSIANAFKIEKTVAPALSEIETHEDEITFTYRDQEYHLTMDVVTDEAGTTTYQNYQLVKADGTQVAITQDPANGAYYFGDENLAGIYMLNTDIEFVYLDKTVEPYQAMAETRPGIDLVIDGHEWKFIKEEDGCKYWNYYGRKATIETAETAVFDGYEGFASKRGFIWARTLPLLKKYVFLGSGADTFSIVFPQHDYVAAYNNGYGDQIISKPHCWYLQVGVQTGVISLIALLVFYGMYFVQSIRLYTRKKIDTYYAQVGLAVFLGTIGYMVAGLTNDSSITVAPVYWALMGIGIFVNHKVKEAAKNQ